MTGIFQREFEKLEQKLIQVHDQSLKTGSWPEFIYMFLARVYI
jgi:hypothetical protein